MALLTVSRPVTRNVRWLCDLISGSLKIHVILISKRDSIRDAGEGKMAVASQ